MSYPVRLALLAFALLMLTASPSMAGDLEDVKAAFEKAIAAQNALDAAAFTATGHDEAVGYDVLSPLPVDTKVMGKAAATQARAQGFANIERIMTTPVNVRYRIFGNTGIAWGHLITLSKPKDGPVRGFYQRVTATYTKMGDKWLAVSYHVSVVPSDSR